MCINLKMVIGDVINSTMHSVVTKIKEILMSFPGYSKNDGRQIVKKNITKESGVTQLL